MNTPAEATATALEAFCQQHKDDHGMPPLKTLCNAEQLGLEYTTFGLSKLVNGLVARSVPANERQDLEFQHYSPDGSVDTCINLNILGCVASLVCAVPSLENDPNLVALGEAVQELYECEARYHFSPPRPNVDFNFQAHDLALAKFQECFTKHLIKLAGLEHVELIQGDLNPLVMALTVYARSLFSRSCFQAPPRFTAEEAMRDSLGETDLWLEYLEAWDLLQYMS
jgi:hypothetical protein